MAVRKMMSMSELGYTFLKMCKTKEEALLDCKKVRKAGYNCRVKKVVGGYYVWGKDTRPPLKSILK